MYSIWKKISWYENINERCSVNFVALAVLFYFNNICILYIFVFFSFLFLFNFLIAFFYGNGNAGYFSATYVARWFFLLKLHAHNGCRSNCANVCKFTMCETLAMDVLPLIFLSHYKWQKKNKTKQIRFEWLSARGINKSQILIGFQTTWNVIYCKVK